MKVNYDVEMTTLVKPISTTWHSPANHSVASGLSDESPYLIDRAVTYGFEQLCNLIKSIVESALRHSFTFTPLQKACDTTPSHHISHWVNWMIFQQ